MNKMKNCIFDPDESNSDRELTREEADEMDA
jgi:hypothetical protein